MKILFVISSINSKSNGKGGHYYSLLETVKQISVKHEVLIVNIGTSPADALQNIPYNLISIINKRSIYKIYHEFNNAVIDFEPEIIHAFDGLAFYWVRIVGRKQSIKVCLTKCGGINQKYFPFSSDLILFSSENLSFFQNENKYKDSNLYLIPNRIQKFKDNIESIHKMEQSIPLNDRNSFKFLRITRIGEYYKESSLQLINLVKKLNDDGIKCCIIFVGTIENKETFNELKNNGLNFTYFFTEKEYTINAKSIINVADAVLGTGRSFMEAAAKGKVLLSPIKNRNTPLLINKLNIKTAFYFNFSERVEIEDYDELSNYNQIKEVITNQSQKNQLERISIDLFEESFNSDKITEKHETVYKNITLNKKARYFDFFLHTLFLLKKYYS